METTVLACRGHLNLNIMWAGKPANSGGDCMPNIVTRGMRQQKNNACPAL